MYAVCEIWILEARYHVTSLGPNPGPTPCYVTNQAHQLLCARPAAPITSFFIFCEATSAFLPHKLSPVDSTANLPALFFHEENKFRSLS